jgi:hypothetical protein
VQLGDEFSEAIKREAKVILMHYPRSFEIKGQSELDERRARHVGEQWQGPEE